MRKLVLTNFKAKTGDYEFEDYRLVVVNHDDGETETDMLLKASKSFMKDFPSYFPESELLSVCPLPTWGADRNMDEDKTVFYSESRLINFAQHVLDRVKTDITDNLGQYNVHSGQDVESEVFKVNAVDITAWKKEVMGKPND